MTSLLRTLLCLLVLAVPLHAGGKKKDDVEISLHLETTAGNNPKMVFGQLVAGKERPFNRVPEIITKDIAAFNAWPSSDGEGYAVMLQLKQRGANRLGAITAANIDRWMLARVNGRIVDALLIDQQIADGKWMIWKGVSLAEVTALDKKIPRIGEKKPRG
jgi:hypothetical protein